MKKKHIDKNFDGHQEKAIGKMSPKEKLEYLSACIELNYIIKNKVKKIGKNK